VALVLESKHHVKILFFTRSLNAGGAERQLVLLARGLHQRGHDVAVALCYSGGPLEADLKETSVRMISLDKRGRWDVFGFLLRLIRTVRSERPDLLYAYIADLMTVFVQPFLRSMKIVWSIRGSNMDLSRYDWLHGTSHTLGCWLSRLPDLIISNSHAGRRDYVAKGYPADRTIVIPNGVDTARFFPNPEARERVRAQWGMAEGEELIGLVGRLDPQKDHETFLQAAVLLLRERKQVRFVCVGNGPSEYKTALKSRAHALGLSDHVMWISAQSQVADVYNALDLLVSSSSFGEGFSNVLGEAMACGVPCVATDVGDSGLVIGDIGQLVPPKDPAALRTAIQTVLVSKPTEAGIRQRIVEHFSLENLVLATERTLLALCHQPSGKPVPIGHNAPLR
jgi:glycosyltransferase involved in cell wall biosynthesis